MSDPYWANVVLLAVNDNAANGSSTFTDQSTNTKTLTKNGTPVYDSSTAPTGMTTSMALNGSTDWLDVSASSDFAFGTSDFTVEYFIKSTAATRQDMITGNRPVGNAANAWTLLFGVVAGNIGWYEQFTNRIQGAFAINSGAWRHIACTQASGSVKLWGDGTQVGSTFASSFTYGNNTITPGIGFLTAGGKVTGNMCSVRFTKGVARYTGAFTVPSLPFSTSSGSIPMPLLHQVIH